MENKENEVLLNSIKNESIKLYSLVMKKGRVENIIFILTLTIIAIFDFSKLQIVIICLLVSIFVFILSVLEDFNIIKSLRNIIKIIIK